MPSLYPKNKKRCYPENIVITETLAEVTVYYNIDHTVTRFAISLNGLFSGVEESNFGSLWLTHKWDCDDTSGLAEYKQLFQNADVSDASILISSFVPVQIIYKVSL